MNQINFKLNGGGFLTYPFCENLLELPLGRMSNGMLIIIQYYDEED